MKTSDYKALYISEAGDILQALESGVMGLEGCDDAKKCVDEIFRNAHNLKGMSGAMGYDAVVEASHALENVLDRCRRGEVHIGPADVDLLLRVVDKLGELTNTAVSEEKPTAATELLGDILVLLSPLTTRETDASRPPCGGDTGDDGQPREAVTQRVPSDDERSSAGEQEKSYPKVISTRVKLESLDRLMDLVGELIISRIRLTGLASELASKPLLEELAASGRLVAEIQKEVMEARLVPVGEIFQRFKRLVRDMARELGKDVELEIVGDEIGLDRTVLESMVEPLVHLVRNALDHGIEMPDERAAEGKPATGKVVLSARRDRNFVIIEVADDGRGIDVKRIMKEGTAGRAGARIGDTLSDEELCSILTAPGFSTSETVGKYSGRGMGMDIVKKKVDSFGGSMHVASNPGKQTVVSLQLPINLSIIKALLFYIDGDVHAIPIEYVCETTRVESTMFKRIRGREVLATDEGAVPLVRPNELFGSRAVPLHNRYIKVIIVEAGDGKVGFVVNRIIGQQEVVIKGLPTILRGIDGISGATILGSGKIAFIWDVRTLFRGRYANESNQETVVSAN